MATLPLHDVDTACCPEQVLFHAVTLQGSALRGLTECSKDKFLGVPLTLDESGITIAAHDNRGTYAMLTRLDASKFESFFCVTPLVMNMCLSLLHNALKGNGFAAGQAATVVLAILRANPTFLVVRVSNASATFVQHKAVPLLEPDASVPQLLPSLRNLQTGQVVATHSVSALKNVFKEIHMAARNVDNRDVRVALTFLPPGTLRIECHEHQHCRTDVTLQAVQQCEVTGPISAQYVAKTLMGFTKGTCVNCDVQLHFREAYPLIMSFVLGDLGSMKFIIAPAP